MMGAEAAHLSVREVALAPDVLLRALLRLDAGRRVQILDSGGARPPDARFLIAGFDPFELIEARGQRLRITRPRESSEEFASGDVLAMLDARLQSYSTESHSTARRLAASVPVAGACIATFSYELAHGMDRLRIDGAPSDANADAAAAAEPDAVLAFYDTLVIHDYERRASLIVSRSGPERLEQAYETISHAASSTTGDDDNVGAATTTTLPRTPDLLNRPMPGRDVDNDFARRELSGGSVASNFTRDEYLAAIGRIKEHIAAGDIYQANLTQRLSVALHDEATPESIFLSLRRDHPAAFAAFIRRREDTVISASPERFLRVETQAGAPVRRVEAWPIKGTRPRGKSAAEDARLRAELQQSEKDRAENVMIVDLLRNDLGRVCRYGSIEVTELCAIQEHPTLFHLVSKVRGILREEVRAGELLRATFPCGSITGAPKLRAMEIIDAVERVPRGLSMGAIGYFSFDGRMDLSVAIRTMVVRERRASFNVGGGIVADSDPALEYEETLTKARALLYALAAH
jgi:para-aminobenzoate synthetase component 1